LAEQVEIAVLCLLGDELRYLLHADAACPRVMDTKFRVWASVLRNR
jgi:hypothetical protein